MALSADSSYIVIPVQDPLLYQWLMWQMWLPYHLAMALHSFIPCACCGAVAGAAFQDPQPHAFGQSTQHCSRPGASVEIRLAEYLDDPNPCPQSAWNQCDENTRLTRPCCKQARKGHRKFKSKQSSSRHVQQPDLDFDYDEELLAYAMDIFCDQVEIADLQCDWNSPGLGFVKNEVCNSAQHEKGPDLPAFTAGVRIVLRGLTKTTLNGQFGTVTTTLLSSGRYGVQLDDGSRIAVRPQNMESHEACGDMFAARSLDTDDVYRRLAACVSSRKE